MIRQAAVSLILRRHWLEAEIMPMWKQPLWRQLASTCEKAMQLKIWPWTTQIVLAAA